MSQTTMRRNLQGMIRASAIALLIAAAAGQPARAADAACKPAVDAMAKQLATPSHMYMTEVAQFRGGKPVTNESIHTGSAIYIQVKGQWRRSPISIQEMQKQHEENQRRPMACSYLRDETVNGEPAAVYRSQADIEGSKSDSTVWVSKRTGLPLRIENDTDVGGKMGKVHRSIRYDYADVRPPAGVK